MSQSKTIICLAASRKHGGTCFAGKDIANKQWIRPVSARRDEEISDQEAQTQTGKAALLDVLSIPFAKVTPKGYQSENHLVDPTKTWTRVRAATWQEVVALIDPEPTDLWPNEDASFGYRNNRISETTARRVASSLRLIRPSKLEISVGRKGGMFEGADRRLVKAHFTLNNLDYILQVTDRVMEARFWNGPDRTENITGALLCVSLGELLSHTGGTYAYKLVASVIGPPQ